MAKLFWDINDLQLKIFNLKYRVNWYLKFALCVIASMMITVHSVGFNAMSTANIHSMLVFILSMACVTAVYTIAVGGVEHTLSRISDFIVNRFNAELNESMLREFSRRGAHAKSNKRLYN